jgi:integrase
MLFQVYSRFVPNLTRRDGSAFEKILERKLHEEHDNGHVTERTGGRYPQ